MLLPYKQDMLFDTAIAGYITLNTDTYKNVFICTGDKTDAIFRRHLQPFITHSFSLNLKGILGSAYRCTCVKKAHIK